MAPSNIIISLATEDDATTLASIMTAAFAASDASYPLIWPSDALHTEVATKGVFTPVQNQYRLTFKAIHSDSKQIVGFATWTLPEPQKEPELGTNKTSSFEELPVIPGVNMKLWREKLLGLREACDRDFVASEDMRLNFFFVHPDFQGKGIGRLLLKWGIEKAEELVPRAKIWLSSTPQAMPTYEKNGWVVMERSVVDLGEYGGKGVYGRAWMVREARETV